MQLVEASSFAVRSAVIQLRRPDTPLEFVLFPMPPCNPGLLR